MGRVARIALCGITFWLFVIAPRETNGAPRVPEIAACIPAAQCCMICDKGYACGNSCISRAKTCHKGRGCSCNATEVCDEAPTP